ncbi:HD domain-containing protein [Dactylonectria macrodidyma]|uniref:5'-deoxynucleotidase n=1 Tax=Dactylonectria macrodidyma TaxID=307937 RepID=A0A9P9D2M8_9HYPO|nr:HD domain-containing protein [Dactylonectria macrodidyma]
MPAGNRCYLISFRNKGCYPQLSHSPPFQLDHDMSMLDCGIKIHPQCLITNFPQQHPRARTRTTKMSTQPPTSASKEPASIAADATPEWSASKALESLGFRGFETIVDKELLFFHIAGRLKSVKRAGWKRHNILDPESVSDHSWRMALIASFVDLPHIDKERVIKMAIIHDLAEVAVGDITPHDSVGKEEKFRREKETMKLLSSMLGAVVGGFLFELWSEFEEKKTAESKVANDIDKIDMILQALDYEKTQDKTLDEFMRVADRITEPHLQDLCRRALKGRNAAAAGHASGPEKKHMDEYYG